MKVKKWTNEEVEKLKTYHLQSIYKKDIETEFGRTFNSINAKARSLNIVIKCKIFKKEKGLDLSLSKEKIIELYKIGKSCNEIGILCNCSNVHINRLLKIWGIEIRKLSESNRKYPIDENYFDIIDCEEKAYVLGLLYADGYNDENKNSVCLGLIESDKEILEKITQLIQPTKPLQYVDINSFNRKEGSKNATNQYRLTMANKKISEDLTKLGCMQAKSLILKFPTEEQVPSHLHSHFIRGYFDGDGYIGIVKKTANVSIISTKDFCESISIIFKKELDINLHSRLSNLESLNKITTAVSFGGNIQVKRFCEYIYKDATIYLERKYRRYLDLLNIEPIVLIKKTFCENCQCTVAKIVKGLCKNCNYKLNGGAEKRRLRFQLTGK